MNLQDFIISTKKIKKLLNETNYITIVKSLNEKINNYINKKGTIKNTETVSKLKNSISEYCKSLIEQYSDIQENIPDVKTNQAFKELKLNKINGMEVVNYLNYLSISKDYESKDVLKAYYQNLELINKFSDIGTIMEQNSLISDSKEKKSDSLVIHFREDASIKNLSELSKSSSKWNQIIHCFGRLSSENDNEAKIKTIETGSIILEIVAAAGIILSLSKAVNSILDIILKTYEVRKKAIELKSLKLSTLKEAITLLEKKAILNVKQVSEEISNRLLKEYQINDKETKNALFLSINILIGFINNGGKVEPNFLNQEDEVNSKLLDSILAQNTKILSIEEELKKIDENKGILKLEN